MRIAYENWTPKGDAAAAIYNTARICRQYAADGYTLTLRQIYYQFVANDLFPDSRKWSSVAGRWVRTTDGTKNADPNYKWLGEIINKARLAGYLDWDHIVDRTRNLNGTSHWDSPKSVMSSAARSYRLDKWRDQRRRVEIWVEKEALAGVVERVAANYDVNWFSCRGYVSQSEQWSAAQRFANYLQDGQAVTILHLGDHDPSGIDMSRDIRDRLAMFTTRDWLNEHADDFPEDTVKVVTILEHMREYVDDGDPLEVRRVALNWDQIQDYQPPPNPTKLTDSRANGYVDRYGHESWELDALPPDVLSGLVASELEQIRDSVNYDALEAREAEHRRLLAAAAERWDELAALLGT